MEKLSVQTELSAISFQLSARAADAAALTVCGGKEVVSYQLSAFNHSGFRRKARPSCAPGAESRRRWTR
jgi:hypothetical protein